MLLLTHLLFGLIIGKITGNMLLVAIGAIIVDIDHIYAFIQSGLIFYPRKVWENIFSPHDPYIVTRTVAHSLLGWIIVTVAVMLVDKQIGAFISIGYLSHLMLDAMDNCQLELLYPLRGHIRGPLIYNSRAEYVFNMILVVVLFVLIYII